MLLLLLLCRTRVCNSGHRRRTARVGTGARCAVGRARQSAPRSGERTGAVSSGTRPARLGFATELARLQAIGGENSTARKRQFFFSCVQQTLVDALLECVYRGENVPVAPGAVDMADAPSVPASPQQASTAAAPVADTYWNRLSGYFSRSYYANDSATSDEQHHPDSDAADSADDVDSEESRVAEDEKLSDDVMVVDDTDSAAVASERQLLRSKFDELATQQLEVCW